jgi:phospholipase C
VHKFYQEQYQLNGGAQKPLRNGSDSAGMSMGVYDTKALPIYKYLHDGSHPHYAIATTSSSGVRRLVPEPPVADLRAHTVVPGAAQDGSSADRHSVLDANGMVQNARNSTRRGICSPIPSTPRRCPGTIRIASGRRSVRRRGRLPAAITR